MANLALIGVRAIGVRDYVVVINRPVDFDANDPAKDGEFALVDPTTFSGGGDEFDILSGGAPDTTYTDLFVFSGGTP